MAIEYCGFASPCPCGCGWVMCTEYGDWRDEDDCESCSDDTRKDGEEDDGQEDE